MFAWKYLNKPSATVAAMQDYSTMREIINITPQETKELYDRMVSVGSRRVTGVPAGWNPQAGCAGADHVAIAAGEVAGYAGRDPGAVSAGSRVHGLV